MQDLTVAELKQRLDAGAKPAIVDVREPWEIKIAALDGALAIPMNQIPAQLGAIPKDRDVVVMCHHGVRSRYVGQFLAQQGFARVFNLKGGIDAWAREIDPAMAKY